MASGSETNTSTSSSAPANPEVDSTLTQLLQGVQGKYRETEAAGNGSTLNGGWQSQLVAAQNPDYARGVAGSTSELADIASGKRFGMNDPGYAQVRSGALNDALTGVGSSFLTDGRYGSSVMGDAAGKAATQTLAGLDYANFQNDQSRQMQAISALPTTFAAGQAPGAAMTNIAQQQQAQPWYNLGQASSILAGTAGAGGQTNTSSTPSTPWWQSAIGIGLGAL